MAGKKSTKSKDKKVIVTDPPKVVSKPVVKKLSALDIYNNTGGGRNELDQLLKAICDKIGL